MSPQLSGKRLELLKEVVPDIVRVAFLWNPDQRGTLLDYNETASARSNLKDRSTMPGQNVLVPTGLVTGRN